MWMLAMAWLMFEGVVLAIPQVTATVSSPTSPQEVQVRQWIESEMNSAFKCPANIGLRYRIDPSEVGDNKTASSRPRATFTTYWESAGGVRISSDLPLSEGAYSDVVVTESIAWSMSKAQLTVVEPQSGYPSGHDYAAAVRAARGQLQLLLTGGLAERPRDTWRITQLRVDDTKWEALLVSDHVRARFAGNWDRDLGRGFITEQTLARTGADSLGTRRTFHDWAHDSQLNRWVASSVTEYRNGVQTRRISWVGVDRRFHERGADLLLLPQFDGSDLVRGNVTYTSVRDYRGGDRIVQRLGDGSEVVLNMGEPVSVRASRRLRLAGWGAAALIIVALIAVRVRQTTR